MADPPSPSRCAGTSLDCEPGASAATTLGRLTVIGPAPRAQDRTCVAGRACAVHGLAGLELSPMDRLAVLETCGLEAAWGGGAAVGGPTCGGRAARGLGAWLRAEFGDAHAESSLRHGAPLSLSLSIPAVLTSVPRMWVPGCVIRLSDHVDYGVCPRLRAAGVRLMGYGSPRWIVRGSPIAAFL